MQKKCQKCGKNDMRVYEGYEQGIEDMLRSIRQDGRK